jgi:dCTP diphosphatase
LSDETMTLGQLKASVTAFRDARDWAQFHTPKNLSMAIAIEAAELMAEFQWLTTQESVGAVSDPQERMRVEEEVADIVIYCLSLADSMGIDLANAVTRKLELNAQKYPEDEYKGRY